MIPKIRALPQYLATVKSAINPIVEIVNKGLVVNSDTVISQRQPDGRIRLKLVPRKAAAKAIAHCFTAENISVTFSGIIFDCGCVDLTLGSGPASAQVLSNTANNTFILSKTGTDGHWVNYTLNIPSIVSTLEFGDSADCSSSGTNFDRDGTLSVYCTDGTTDSIDAGTYIWLNIVTLPTIYTGGFFAYIASQGQTSFGNELTSCGLIINTPASFWGSTFTVGIGHSGTATITPV